MWEDARKAPDNTRYKAGHELRVGNGIAAGTLLHPRSLPLISCGRAIESANIVRVDECCDIAKPYKARYRDKPLPAG
jgi:hypothetical protein